MDASSAPERRAQVRTIGLVDPAYRAAEDGLARIAEQEPFRPGVDLDDIWDTLGEADKIRAGAVERFRLEMEASLRLAAKPWQAPHLLGGRLDARALKRGLDNLAAEIAALEYMLAADSRALLARFVSETHKLLEQCLRQRAVQGIESAAMYDILRDLVHKLIYQELTSRRRGMGDRGIRRISGNIELADKVYEQLKRLPGYSPRQRLLMRIIHVHQDLGYTAYAARSSYRGGRLHRAYGARIFTDEINRLRVLLTHQELQLVRSAVATHSSEELPFAAMRVPALVRAIDHLAPFAPFRVYKHLEAIEGASDYLDDLLERARAGDMQRYCAAKDALARFLAERDSSRRWWPTSWPPSAPWSATPTSSSSASWPARWPGCASIRRPPVSCRSPWLRIRSRPDTRPCSTSSRTSCYGWRGPRASSRRPSPAPRPCAWPARRWERWCCSGRRPEPGAARGCKSPLCAAPWHIDLGAPPG